MPPADNDRPRRVPGAIDLILVLLQPDQPPAAPAHGDGGYDAADQHAQKAARPGPGLILASAGPITVGSAQDHAHAAARAEDQQHRQNHVVPPAAVARVAPENGEEAEDLNAEQRQAEHLARRRQAAGQHGGGHQSGVGGQRRHGKFVDTNPGARIIEEENIDGQQPEGHGPDAVGGGREGQGLEDRGQAEQGEVDEDCGLDGVHAQVSPAASKRRRGPVFELRAGRVGGRGCPAGPHMVRGRTGGAGLGGGGQ